MEEEVTEHRDRKKETGSLRDEQESDLVPLGGTLASIKHMSVVGVGLHFCEWNI